MNEDAAQPIIDLDAAAYRKAILIFRFEGEALLLTRERINELLRRERELVARLTDAAAEATEPAPRVTLPPASRGYQPPPEGFGTLSHATLSYRVKRIHDYGARQRRIRETHVAILDDLLASFDGRIPDHPSPALEENLTALLRWRSVPQPLKDTIQRFLAGYLEAKARRGR